MLQVERRLLIVNVRLEEAIMAQLDRLLSFEPGVRADEPTATHQMRVATRRLRAWARFVEELAPARASLKELANALGAVRDLDVLLAGLERDASEPERPALAAFAEARRPGREASRAALLARLDGPLLGELRALRDRLGEAEVGVPRARTHVRDSLRRLRRGGRGLKAARAEQLHAIRIAAKRYRYTLELLAPELKPEIDLATAIQDTLGALNDDELAVAALLDYLVANPSAHPLAAQLRLRLTRRDPALTRFQVLWRELPTGKTLARRLRGQAS